MPCSCGAEDGTHVFTQAGEHYPSSCTIFFSEYKLKIITEGDVSDMEKKVWKDLSSQGLFSLCSLLTEVQGVRQALCLKVAFLFTLLLSAVV